MEKSFESKTDSLVKEKKGTVQRKRTLVETLASKNQTV